MSSTAALWTSIIGGLVIVLLAIGIPYLLTHRRMRPQDDPGERQAYLEATERNAQDIAEGRPGQQVHPNKPAARQWQSTALGRVQDADDPAQR